MQYVMPHPMSWFTRIGILFLLLLIASLPVVIYFQFEQQRLLLALLLILIAVQIVLDAHTAAMAVSMMSKLRKVTGNWDLLAMTGIEARSLSSLVWLSTIRRTWVDHALLALPRLGVSLGFVQFLHASPMGALLQSDVISNARPFPYYSFNQHYGLPPAPEIYPDATQVMVALVVLFVYAISEGALAAAGGVMWSMLRPQYEATAVGLTIFSRLLTVGLALVVFAPLAHVMHIYDQQAQPNTMPPIELIRWHVDNCASVGRAPTDDWFFQSKQQEGQQLQQVGRCDDMRRELMFLRAIEGIQVTMESFLDQGVLLGANVMRPIVSYDDPHYFGVYTDDKWTRRASYWPFVARNIISALVALSIYAALIWLALRIACYGLARHGLVNEPRAEVAQ